MIIEGYSGIAAGIRSGLLRPIAVASSERLPDFPDLPTVSETIPGFTATGWQVLVAPVGTPDPIIRKLSEDLSKIVNDPDLKQKLGALGSYTRSRPPEQVTAFVQNEQRTWQPVLDQIG